MSHAHVIPPHRAGRLGYLTGWRGGRRVPAQIVAMSLTVGSTPNRPLRTLRWIQDAFSTISPVPDAPITRLFFPSRVRATRIQHGIPPSSCQFPTHVLPLVENPYQETPHTAHSAGAAHVRCARTACNHNHELAKIPRPSRIATGRDPNKAARPVADFSRARK